MAVPSPLRRRTTVGALLTLTVVTGLVDAVSYLRLGRVFVANMTGNFVFLGFSADRHSGLSSVASIVAIAGFVLSRLPGLRAAAQICVKRRLDFRFVSTCGSSLSLSRTAVPRRLGRPATPRMWRQAFSVTTTSQ